MWISVIISKTSKNEIEDNTEIFQRRARIIEDIFNRNLALKKIKLQGVQKITITLTMEKDRDVIVGPMKGFSPVVNITKTFDPKLVKSLPDKEQNEMVLSIIENCLRESAKKFGWDFHSFDEIIDMVRQLDFKHSYLEWKLKPSKDRKYKAGVETEMNNESAKILIAFYSQDGVLIRKVNLINVRPDRFFIKHLMGEGKWLTSTEFELTDKKNEIHFKASVLSDKVDVYFTPINRDVNNVIDDLLLLSASTTDEQAISILREKIKDNQNEL
jgi:hypothetical protein